MPAVGTKQKRTSERAIAASAAPPPQVTPAELLIEFERICVALPVSAALIAVRDLPGLRCTVSFGKGPAVRSQLPTDNPFILDCFETGEIALSEDAQFDPRIDSAEAVRLGFRSALAVPIPAQGHIVGLIQVFCFAPSAFSPAAIARVEHLAKSFATVMISDAVEGGPSLVGGPLHQPVVLPRLTAPDESLSTGSLIRDEQKPHGGGPPPPFSASSLLRAPEGIERLEGTQRIQQPKPRQRIEAPANHKIARANPQFPAAAPAKPAQPSRAHLITRLVPEIERLSAAVTRKFATFIGRQNRSAQQGSATPGTAQLPSDRPIPPRVWLIAGVLLLAISLLFLFLLRGVLNSEDPADDSLSRPIYVTQMSAPA
jgi:GAF domain